VVTTPNQLSLLSKLTLVLKNQFNAFQEAPGLYPAHLTALLEVDLLRIARECGLADPTIRHTDSGRIPFTPWHWPRGFRGRAFSDNVLLAALKQRHETRDTRHETEDRSRVPRPVSGVEPLPQ
jgi:hypothetical protein